MHIKNVIARSKVSSGPLTAGSMRNRSALTTKQGTRSEQALPLNNLKHFKDM